MKTLETWKDIKGYEGYYQVSDMGNVRSLDHITYQINNKGILAPFGYKWILLKFDVTVRNHTSYKSVRLCVQNKTKKFQVHRLVWSEFLWLDINNPKDFICHKDDNGMNNEVTNLFVWDRRINSIDMYSKWRWVDNWWDRNWMSKLKLENVLDILSRKELYLSDTKERLHIANKYWVSSRCIRDICKWIRWKKYYNKIIWE